MGCHYRLWQSEKIESDASWICGILEWVLAICTRLWDYNELSAFSRRLPG